jgi:hypothetical protein
MLPGSLSATPPFSLAPATFRFRAIASLAGNAPLGGHRESILACYVVGRLAAGLLLPYRLDTSAVRTRAGHVKSWLGSHALPPLCRTACAKIVDGVGRGDRAQIGTGLTELTQTLSPYLDTMAMAEMNGLIRAFA